MAKQELELLLNSILFYKNLFMDGRQKILFQLKPAIEFSLQYILEVTLEKGELTPIVSDYDTDTLIKISKQAGLIDKKTIKEISVLLNIVEDVEKLPEYEEQENGTKIEEIQHYIKQADILVEQTKRIIRKLKIPSPKIRSDFH